MEDIGPYQPIPYQISLLSYESSHSLFNKLPWNQLSWTCLPAVHEQEVNIKSKSIHLHYSQQTPINVILHLIFRQAASANLIYQKFFNFRLDIKMESNFCCPLCPYNTTNKNAMGYHLLEVHVPGTRFDKQSKAIISIMWIIDQS